MTKIASREKRRNDKMTEQISTAVALMGSTDGISTRFETVLNEFSGTFILSLEADAGIVLATLPRPSVSVFLPTHHHETDPIRRSFGRTY